MPPKLPACGFAFTAKYEGTTENIPVPQMKVKKVSKGKRITVVFGAVGSRLKAIATLKQLLGVGGEVSADDHTAIELQGDQTKRIPVILKNIGALVCDEQPTNRPVKVERSNYQYDKFMKKTENSQNFLSNPDQPVSDACILVHGKFWPYCNGHCQYCPPLTDVFEGLEQFCSWFESDSTKNVVDAKPLTSPMTRDEIYSGLSSLGMTAQVGAAVKQYEQDKKKYLKVPFVEKPKPVVVLRSQPRNVSAVPRPVRRFDPNAPVRVIMNHLQDEDEEWFVLKISMVDRSLWISDYEEFIHSLVSGNDDFVPAQIELMDSRILRIRFWTGQDRDACKQLLSEAMESMLEFTSSDAVIDKVYDEVVDEVPDELEPHIPQLEFQRIAEELGIESNDEFWEIFCNLIDISDGTTEGVARAFNEAILRVLDDSPTS
jgi:translation initiation factor 1 (eIF-1/SUI1)